MPIADWSALLMVVITLIYTGFAGLQWWATRKASEETAKTVAILQKQQAHQTAYSYSLIQHQTADAHRQLYWGLLCQPDLFKEFCHINGMEEPDCRRWLLATLIINQCFRVFLDLHNGILDPDYGEAYKRDARGVFAWPLVQEHWHRNKGNLHPAFNIFVEAELLASPTAQRKSAANP